MNIDDKDVKNAKSGDNHALVQVLDAHLIHMRAVADLLVVASSDEVSPDSLNNLTVRDAAWMIEVEAAKALEILNEWESANKKGEAA